MYIEHTYIYIYIIHSYIYNCFFLTRVLSGMHPQVITPSMQCNNIRVREFYEKTRGFLSNNHAWLYSQMPFKHFCWHGYCTLQQTKIDVVNCLYSRENDLPTAECPYPCWFAGRYTFKHVCYLDSVHNIFQNISN